MREYGKEDIYKPKRTNNTAISRNLPVAITLPGTATAYTVTARKEGRKEKYVYRYLNCIVIGY